MAWGCTSLKGKDHLFLINGTMDIYKYKDVLNKVKFGITDDYICQQNSNPKNMLGYDVI